MENELTVGVLETQNIGIPSTAGTASDYLPFICMIGADFVALSLSCAIALGLKLVLDPSFHIYYISSLAMYFPTFFIMIAVLGLYPGLVTHPVDELRKLVSAVSVTMLAVLAATFFQKRSLEYSRMTIAFMWVIAIVLLPLCRALVRYFCARQTWWGRPTLIFGAGKTGNLLATTLQKQPRLGLRPVGLLDDDPYRYTPAADGSSPAYLGPLAMAPEIAAKYSIQYAIVAMPGVPSSVLSTILSRYALCFPHFLVIPDLFGMSSLWVEAKDVGGILGLEVNQVLTQKLPQALKRSVDIVISSVALIVLSPLLALICLAIRVTTTGPVVYKQSRIGKGRRTFKAWKFCSMIPNADEVLQRELQRNAELSAEWKRDHKLKRDPRVTAIGKLLRKTSLDELPQLWNVFRGDMSLVGPRPIVEAEIEKYGDRFHFYSRVRPGITGLWQVSGRNNTTYDERTRFDEYYVRNWSLWLDIYLLTKTIQTVLLAEGAY